MRFNTIILILLYLFLQLGTTDKSHLRIIGGRNATTSEFPYVVELVSVDGFPPVDIERFCSGAVITPTWSLTAAHCTSDSEFTAIRYDHKIAQIFEFIQHPKFNYIDYNNKEHIHNDFALLKHDVVNLKEYGRVSAIEYTALYGQKATCAGFGASKRKIKKRLEKNTHNKGVQQYDYEYPKGLIVLSGLIVKCEENLYFQVYPQICVAVSCNDRPSIRFVAQGDSGSPLIHGSGIVGLLSAGIDGITEGQAYAGFYVPISYTLRWIRNEIKEDFKVRTT